MHGEKVKKVTGKELRLEKVHILGIKDDLVTQVGYLELTCLNNALIS